MRSLPRQRADVVHKPFVPAGDRYRYVHERLSRPAQAWDVIVVLCWARARSLVLTTAWAIAQ